MGRYFSSLVFLIAGVAVGVFNDSHTDRALVFPFLTSIFPSLEGNPHGQGLASAGLLLGIGALLGTFAVLQRRRDQA